MEKMIELSKVVEYLEKMKAHPDATEWDESKRKDTIYCVEFGIRKANLLNDKIIDRAIKELSK